MKLRNKVVTGLLAGMLSISLTISVVGAFEVCAAEETTSATEIANDATGIPDKILYDSVLAASDSNHDGKLTTDEAATVTELFTTGVNDFTGIGFCTSLQKLVSDKGTVSDLSPLKELKSLTLLAMQETGVSDLTPLASLTTLKEIHIYNPNQATAVTDITPLAKLVNLEILDLNDNKVSDLTPLKNLTKLTKLYLNDNQIVDVTPLANLTNLTEVYLMVNRIVDVTPFTNLTKLRVLNLYFNEIVDASPLNGMNLEELVLGGNPIPYEQDAVKKPIISEAEMNQLIQENKNVDVIIKSNDGITFTFAKGTMASVEGMQNYNFATKLVLDYANAGTMGAELDASKFVAKVQFEYSGQLPAEATIRIPVGKQFAGKELYYSQISGNGFTHMMTTVVDAEGFVTVKQNHCSDYVLTTVKLGTEKVSDRPTSPKTGDISNMHFYVLFGAACGLALSYGRKKKIS